MAAAAAVPARYLVTGANKGIGLALVGWLLETAPAGSRVLLGSRDVARGEAARATLPEAVRSRVDVLELDVANAASVAAAAAQVKKMFAPEERPLRALINNAGFGLGGEKLRDVLEVNTWGLKRVTDAFLPLVARPGGRVVQVTSAAGPVFVAKVSKERKEVLTKPKSFEQVDGVLAELLAIAEDDSLDEAAKTAAYEKAGFGDGSVYHASKAFANAYVVLQAAEQDPSKPDEFVTINALTPGFIETDLTRHFTKATGKSAEEMGMKKPTEAMAAFNTTLFTDCGHGLYFGSDGIRSPLHKYRGPGDPPYTGNDGDE